MFRLVSTTRLLAKLHRIANAVECVSTNTVISDALRLAAGTVAAEALQHAESSGTSGYAAHRAAYNVYQARNVTTTSNDQARTKPKRENPPGADTDDASQFQEHLQAAMEANVYDREMAILLAEAQAEMDDPASINHDQLRKESEAADECFLAPEPGPGPRIYNEAGRHRPGWQIYGLDEENLHLVMGLDTTGGQVADNDQNALLSDEAKDYMAWMHQVYPEECTPEFLARIFKIRVQRVMAILALKSIERKAQEKREREEWEIVKAAQDKIRAAGSFDAAGYGRGSENQAQESEDGSAAEIPTDEQTDSQTAASAEDSAANTPLEENGRSTEAATESKASGGADEDATASVEREGMAADGAPGQADNSEDESDWGSDDEIPVKGGGNLWGKDLAQYSSDPMTGEIAGIDYRYMEDLQVHEVDAFTKPMHTLDVTNALRDTIEHDIWNCVEAEGSYERHVKLLPSYPEFKEGPDGRLVHCGLTQDQLEEKATMEAEQEEEAMIHMFQRNLEWNLGLAGKDVQRESRIKHPPRRPKQGWNLVVEPLTNKKNQQKQDLGPAYVAEPSGKRRPLTESESQMLERTRPLPRRRTM